MNKNFFYKKKILITGIDGFVGSNLAKKLVFVGAKVSGIIQKKNKKSLFNYEKINKKCTLYKGDIYNNNFIKKIITNNKFEIIFHLAAQVEVGVANYDPFDTWESNIRGTYTILNNLVKNKNIKSVIVASSDKSYGEYPKKYLPYKESYLSKAIYPYDVSKACADMISKSYSSKLFNLPIITTRFANIYGPGQLHFSALIPDIMKSLITGKKFIPRGNGNDIRDYVFIDDIVDVYLILSKKLYKNPNLKGEVFNAGTNKQHKVREIVKMFYVINNQVKEYQEILKKMKNKKTIGEINNQFMDYSKLKKFFGWKPKHDFNTTAKTTYEWYKEYFKKNS